MKRKSNSSARYGYRLFLTALITAMLGLMLSACGKADSKAQSGADAETTYTGKYTAAYDVLPIINEQIESIGVTLDEPLEAEFTLELKDDDTYTFSVDANSMMEKIKDVLSENVDDIIDQILMTSEGSGDTDKEEIAKMAGYDSYDAFREEMQNTMTSAIDDSFKAELQDNLNFDGTYTIEGSKLILSSEGEDDSSIEEGTIQDDGSILIKSKWGDYEAEVTFTK